MLKKIKRYIKLKAFSGNTVYCPCCEKGFHTFLPKKGIGGIYRHNSICLNCNSLERDRLLILFLRKKTNLFKDKIHLLHVSPERSLFNLLNRQPNITYNPVDKFEDGYEYPKSTEYMDITEITKKNNTYDAIICSNVLEHVPDDKKAMSELYRVLKPGGWAIIQVPIDYNREQTYEDLSITDRKAREKAFGWPDHVRWYGKDYFQKLRDTNFQVEIQKYASEFSEEELFKYGIIPNDSIFLCKK